MLARMRAGALLAFPCVAIVACATPYQASGVRGGYKSERLSEGRYFVSFEGNGYTPASTVTQYLHRRARDVCSQAGYGSYVFLDADGNTSTGAWIQRGQYGTTVTPVEKHERSAIVQCTEPASAPTAAVLPAPAPVQAPTSAAAEWYCTTLLGDGFETSMCRLTPEQCEDMRTQAVSVHGLRASTCARADRVACSTHVTDGQPLEFCHNTMQHCVSFAAQQNATPCAERGRMAPTPATSPRHAAASPWASWHCFGHATLSECYSTRTMCEAQRAQRIAKFGEAQSPCSEQASAVCRTVVPAHAGPDGMTAKLCNATREHCERAAAGDRTVIPCGPAESFDWYCTGDPAFEIDGCFEMLDWCQLMQRTIDGNLSAEGVRMSECRTQGHAFCFERIDKGKPVKDCHSTGIACVRGEEQSAAQGATITARCYGHQ
jgi:hypothetical protein